jgi:hypothetical protein
LPGVTLKTSCEFWSSWGALTATVPRQRRDEHLCLGSRTIAPCIPVTTLGGRTHGAPAALGRINGDAIPEGGHWRLFRLPPPSLAGVYVARILHRLQEWADRTKSSAGATRCKAPRQRLSSERHAKVSSVAGERSERLA